MTDFTVTLNDLDGNPMLDSIAMQSNGGNPVNITLGRAVANALLADYPDEGILTGEAKFHRAKLAVDLRGASDASPAKDDIDIIKAVVARRYTPLVVYRVWGMLDQPTGE